MPDRLPFSRRFDTGQSPLIDQDFPDSARLGLYHILLDLVESERVSGWKPIVRELWRLTRSNVRNVKIADLPAEEVQALLNALPWPHVFEFCERVYSKLLISVTVWEDHSSREVESLKEVQAYFSDEINQLIGEENLAFEFVGGHFQRPGHHATQKLSADAYKVLGAPELRDARFHYQKALRFFRALPQGDYPNAVKEAVSALESAIKALCPEEWSSDFSVTLKKLQGTTDGKIPPTLTKAMDAIYAFRGAASGVTHGGATGGFVTFATAELVLNCVSSFITFIVAHRATESTAIPF